VEIPYSSGSSGEVRHPGRRLKSIGAKATGALAVGAVAIGALAIGALGIGRLAVVRARIRHFPEDLPVSVIPPEDMDPEEFLTNRARVDLEKLSARIGQPGATLEVVVSTHSARREIVKYAQGHGIDLIVVG
jgi:nucleotide-binding universal stress UspA family protein